MCSYKKKGKIDLRLDVLIAIGSVSVPRKSQWTVLRNACECVCVCVYKRIHMQVYIYIYLKICVYTSNMEF